MEEYRNKVVNLQAKSIPRISVNFPVKLTGTNPEVKGGAIGAPPASLSRPYSAPGRGVLGLGDPLGAMGTMGHGTPVGGIYKRTSLSQVYSPTHGTPLGGVDTAARRPMAPGREINGYPFTTFTDFSDFLGIIPRVSSGDLAYYVDFH